jgi:hypothetical protein
MSLHSTICECPVNFLLRQRPISTIMLFTFSAMSAILRTNFARKTVQMMIINRIIKVFLLPSFYEKNCVNYYKNFTKKHREAAP